MDKDKELLLSLGKNSDSDDVVEEFKLPPPRSRRTRRKGDSHVISPGSSLLSIKCVFTFIVISLFIAGVLLLAFTLLTMQASIKQLEMKIKNLEGGLAKTEDTAQGSSHEEKNGIVKLIESKYTMVQSQFAKLNGSLQRLQWSVNTKTINHIDTVRKDVDLLKTGMANVGSNAEKLKQTVKGLHRDLNEQILELKTFVHNYTSQLRDIASEAAEKNGEDDIKSTVTKKYVDFVVSNVAMNSKSEREKLLKNVDWSLSNLKSITDSFNQTHTEDLLRLTNVVSGVKNRSESFQKMFESSYAPDIIQFKNQSAIFQKNFGEQNVQLIYHDDQLQNLTSIISNIILSRPTTEATHVVSEGPEIINASPGNITTERPEIINASPGNVATERPEIINASPENVATERPEIINASPGNVVTERPEIINASPGNVATERPEIINASPGNVDTERAVVENSIPEDVVTERPQIVNASLEYVVTGQPEIINVSPENVVTKQTELPEVASTNIVFVPTTNNSDSGEGEGAKTIKVVTVAKQQITTPVSKVVFNTTGELNVTLFPTHDTKQTESNLSSTVQIPTNGTQQNSSTSAPHPNVPERTEHNKTEAIKFTSMPITKTPLGPVLPHEAGISEEAVLEPNDEMGDKSTSEEPEDATIDTANLQGPVFEQQAKKESEQDYKSFTSNGGLVHQRAFNSNFESPTKRSATGDDNDENDLDSLSAL